MIQILSENSIKVSSAFEEMLRLHPVLGGDEYADIADGIRKGLYSGVTDMYAAVIAQGVGRQIKQGLFRDYIRVREDLPVMHGSLDIAGTIRNRLNRKYLISCESDNLSVNNPHNRLLKAVMLYLLRRDEVSRQTRTQIKKQVLAFDGIEDVEPGAINRASLSKSRCNATYMMLMDICGRVVSSGE